MDKKFATWSASALCMAFAMSFASHFFGANANDPSLLQDFCVGVNDPDSAVFVNGKFCKNPNDVTIDDFLYKGFNVTGNTDNILGVSPLLVDVNKFPAINTLGVALARIDYKSLGLNTPHLHPRSSEIFAVLKGTLYVGFVTTEYKLFDAVLNEGDMIVFPQGLIHFQLNIGEGEALAIAAFGSQLPGRVNVAEGVFGTKPPISDYVLTKGFQVDETVIEELRSQFSADNLSVHTGRSILKLFSQGH